MRPPRKTDAVAIGDYTFESQGCADAVPEGYHYPDGYITNRATRAPFQIPYGCLLPKGVDNLLVPGAVSATHIAFGAVRVEAARIAMGTAAGVAAALAIEKRCTPAQVSVDALQAELVARGVKLTYFADVDAAHPHFRAVQWAALRGYVPADPDWRFAPDHPADWGAFVEATVVCLDLPISVSGAHFEGMTRHDASYRYAESLYDLGTRAGLDLFGARRLVDEDPMQEFLRVYPGFKLLSFNARKPVRTAEAQRFLGAVARAISMSSGPAFAWSAESTEPESSSLTRGAMCALLRAVWSATGDGFARARAA